METTSKDKEAMTAIDVVCGMEVDVEQVLFRLEMAGQQFYFCSEGCEAEFKRHLDDYVIDAAGENGDV